jgi:hypothetical protein
MKHYKAPWSMVLMVASSVVSVLLLGVSLGLAFFARGPLAWVATLPVVILLCSVPFTIRGYAITADAIVVQRLFWTTRLPLSGLKSATFEPEAMQGSIRLFGNGGLFSICGFFRNKSLGTYRAWVTDPHQTVVLRFQTRIVVVSPSVPEDFVRRLTQ